MFSDENDFFFSMFGYIPKNTSKNILQCCVKDKAKGTKGEAYVFGKWFMKIGHKQFFKF